MEKLETLNVIQYFYAVADAAGNIYPGTFAENFVVSKCFRMYGNSFSVSLERNGQEWDVLREIWQPYADRGDHVVRCKIETDDNVKVTTIP